MHTLEQLQAKRAAHVAARDRYEAQANACTGAIAVLDELIAEMVVGETAPATNPQPPATNPQLPP